jgi:hypothetical protein
MSRAVIVVCLCATLAACASAPKLWTRADGGPIMQTQYEVDATVCRGELQKARMAGTGQLGLISRMNAQDDIYTGCMAAKGYVQRTECPTTAGGACAQ